MLVYQCFGQLHEHRSVGLAHTHQVLIDIDARFVHIAVGKLVHHIVEHQVGVNAWTTIHRAMRRNTIGQTDKFHIRLQTKVVIAAYCHTEVHRALPLIGREHLHDHHL